MKTWLFPKILRFPDRPNLYVKKEDSVSKKGFKLFWIGIMYDEGNSAKLSRISKELYDAITKEARTNRLFYRENKKSDEIQC